MKSITLDPIGYFLIRINKNKIEIGFCRYKDMVLGKSNKVLEKFKSESPKEIIAWAKENKLYSKNSHLTYLKKELSRAKSCINKKKKYIQS